MAVPALHEVNKVEHDDESHWDVDITVVARAGPVDVAASEGVVLLYYPLDDSQSTPGNGGQTPVDEEG